MGRRFYNLFALVIMHPLLESSRVWPKDFVFLIRRFFLLLEEKRS